MTDWRHPNLGQICRFISGGTPSTKVERYYQGEFPWITSADINGNVVTKARLYITEEAIESSATNLVPKGNILLVTRTGVGKVAVNDVDICISQDFTALLPDKLIVDLWFLFYYLKLKQPHFVANQRGATIQGIIRDVVSDLNVPLPPLPEQKRIAAILAKADRLRHLRRYALQLSDTFLQSVFLQMFGDPVTNPMAWQMATIGDVILESQYGTSQKSNSKGIGYPVIGMSNISYSGQLDIESTAYVDLGVMEFERLRLLPGDIIFNRTNSTELVGKTTSWTYDNNAVLASYLVKLKLDNRLLPSFFTTFLNSNYYKQLFRQRCRKAIGQSNISPTLLKEFPILIPPLELQIQFKEICRKFETLQTKQREAIRQADNLFATLLHRAFRGEL